MSTKSEKASFQLPLIREQQRANSILPIRCNLAKMAQESDFLAERIIDEKVLGSLHTAVPSCSVSRDFGRSVFVWDIHSLTAVSR